MKIILDNPFPRSQVTTHIGRAPAFYYGPFARGPEPRSSKRAARDLFQMRRCSEDLDPSPDHPGCIYGEMGMCLRPCQQVVGVEEYRHEVDRVKLFLSTGGRSLAATVTSARDRLSQEMDFEEAARQHKRLEKIEGVLRLKDELVADIDHSTGWRSQVHRVQARWNCGSSAAGPGRQPVRFEVAAPSVSLDQRLREIDRRD